MAFEFDDTNRDRVNDFSHSEEELGRLYAQYDYLVERGFEEAPILLAYIEGVFSHFIMEPTEDNTYYAPDGEYRTKSFIDLAKIKFNNEQLAWAAKIVYLLTTHAFSNTIQHENYEFALTDYHNYME